MLSQHMQKRTDIIYLHQSKQHILETQSMFFFLSTRIVIIIYRRTAIISKVITTNKAQGVPNCFTVNLNVWLL